MIDLWLNGNRRGDIQVRGCERAVARSHPQTWDFLTVDPGESDLCLYLARIPGEWRRSRSHQAFIS
jgi:hypothetical protein